MYDQLFPVTERTLNMQKTILTISGPEGDKDLDLDPHGMTVGRGSTCDVILDSSHVSRTHARIYQDPFGRWVIEDLNSHNGMFVEGQRVAGRALLPGERVSIRPYTLSISQETDQSITSHSPIGATMTPTEAILREEVLRAKRQEDRPLLKHLNEITKDLLELPKADETYDEACRLIARKFDTPVAVVRLPTGSATLPDSPETLAYHSGRDESESSSVPGNFYLSRRVLDAVRKNGAAALGRSASLAKNQVVLTIVDEQSPHLVVSAPVSEISQTVDVLYVDILEGHAPSDIFEFVEAVARQIDFARRSLLLSEAKMERRILDEQLSSARTIQSKLIPTPPDCMDGIDLAICYRPAMWVGGDYCDIWITEGERIAFAVGDVSGKGLPAAMVMSNLQALLRTTMAFCSDLSVAVGYINDHLADNLPEGMFVTFFLGLLDRSTGELAYVNAGHILPLYIRGNEGVGPLGSPANLPLGILKNPFTMAVETIGPNSGLLVVTDGVTEAVSPAGEEFGSNGLATLVGSSKFGSAEDLVHAVTAGLKNFCGPLPQHDDVTLLALLNRNRSD